jgi:hypothetical protein
MIAPPGNGGGLGCERFAAARRTVRDPADGRSGDPAAGPPVLAFPQNSGYLGRRTTNRLRRRHDMTTGGEHATIAE